MDKIMDLFNTPQAELTYMDQLTMALVWVIPFTIILVIICFIIEKRNKWNIDYMYRVPTVITI